MKAAFAWAAAAVLLATACGGVRVAPSPPPILPFATDSNRSETLGRGAIHRYFHAPGGPWAIHVLQVDLDACYRVVAVKGAPGAVGREKTSTLLDRLGRTERVIGGVNADFFLFTPPGVPANAMISRGRLVTGPSAQPVFALDSSGAPHLLTLTTIGAAWLTGRRFAIQGWNRAVPDGLALFDASWSSVMDTASAAIEVVLRGSEPGRVVRVDTTAAGTEIPGDGAVLVARQGAPADLRAALLALHPGDTIRTDVRLEPFHPAEAVGGRPILVRDSAVTDAVDTEGQPGFAGGRHPRTAAGIARGGRRLILVTVDGRQKPYSDGMTLRELAGLLLVLGARDAINLDGGGSTTMVLGGPAASDTLRLVNRPSDSAGERPVGNALAVIASARTCRETRP